MDHIVYIFKGAVEAFFIAHVTDKKAHSGQIRLKLRHILHDKLFIFVAGEDDYFFDIRVFCKYGFGKFLAKAARSAGD